VMSEMRKRAQETGSGPIGEAMRNRYRDLAGGNDDTKWRAIRDVLLPTLLDIADELDALREERGHPKRGRGG